MRTSSVVVVGGGAAGLSAAGALRHRGIDALVLEQDAAIGGTWARRYDRLHLHTTRRFSGLAHFPIPRRYPQYLSRDDVVSYLEEYARHFGLTLVTGVTIATIRRAADAPGWEAIAADGERWRAPVVVIATGQYRRPIVPAWPGRDRFDGRLTHSVEYRTGAPYAGQRVLVVGAGNSGAEIATDLADSGATVTISIRTPPPIVPRDPFGMPVQRTSILLSALPSALSNALGRLTARLTIGDLTRYGMPAAVFNPYSTRRVPLIDVGFVDALARGRVAVRPAVERLTPDGAVFADGRAEPFDAIVAATGFASGLEMLLGDADLLDGDGVPIGVAGAPTARRGLYFVGFTHSLRGHLFEANLASRRLARYVARDLQTR
ncbi:MAG TPA: NAD(P)/FAD-dependent oxidoreductase [Vicinamibacterales bacterium]|nr:NAD(P)/FAD-dependent oxidoreductase [Vicinamibacterales bacterium]